MPKEYVNYIEMEPSVVGNDRREEIIGGILDNNTLVPNAVTYKDIDESFKEWAETLRIIDDGGREFPTMSLYSNQRFSEYSQTWDYTDDNNNILLNFKSVTRENNPKYGQIQSSLWNIPGDRFFTIRKYTVVDDNGTESFRTVKVKQPTAVNMIFKLTIFTTLFEKINEFNELITKIFNSRQCYISPNGHYMPMVLEDIADKSEYQIEDRRFYSQEYTIKLMGYIITEEDFRVEETPLKKGVEFKGIIINKIKPQVNIDDSYENKPCELTIDFPPLKNKSTFTIDTDMKVDDIILENVLLNYKIYINDTLCEFTNDNGITFHDNDKIDVVIKRRNPLKDASIKLLGKSLNEAILKV